MTRRTAPEGAARPILAAERDLGKISSGPLSDLASMTADQVLDLWARVERDKATREADPELREAILRCCGALADRERAATIRAELDQAHPAIVLEANWRVLIGNRPALGSFTGAFPRRDREVIPTANEWLKDDPRRLAGVVAEMRRFTSDLPKIVQSALDLADSAGIDEQLADRVICAALRDRRQVGHAN